MNLVIDIGGTHFRIRYGKIFYKFKHNLLSKQEMFELIENKINYFLNENNKKINDIVLALPGIVKNNKLHECNNLSFLNYTHLPEKILGINCIYINDGDLALLGEMKYNNLSNTYNILNLIFGTGVGSGIWCNNIIYNSEVVSIFEEYLGGKNFDKSKIDQIKIRFLKDLSKIIELLNLDIIIINGFIKNYEELIVNKEMLFIRNFYRDKIRIIYSDCVEPVLYGGDYIHLLN